MKMAYSNWGAFVYENGKRRFDKEDVGVFNTDEHTCPSGLRIFANIMKNQDKFPEGKIPWYTHSHHAVLGDREVRLCGYKSSPELWVCRGNTPERIPLDEDNEDCSVNGTVDANEKTWKYVFAMYNGNMVDLRLEESDGTVWTSTCGYQYGAGHMED